MTRRVVLALALMAYAAAGPAFAAGDVTVQQKGASLKITGDDLDNAIVITQPDPDEFTVTGGGTTTINGLASESFVGVSGNINIATGDGTDNIRFDDSEGAFDIGGALTIKWQGDTAFGSLTLASVGGNVKLDAGKTTAGAFLDYGCGGCLIDGNMIVKSGSGDLVLGFDTLDVAKNLTILGKPSTEDITITGFSSVGGSFKLKTKPGDSTVLVTDMEVGKKFEGGKAPKGETRITDYEATVQP